MSDTKMGAVEIQCTVAGVDYDLTANTGDILNYEQTAYQQHFPPLDKGGQITFAAFLAWSAARRTKQTELKWSEWRTQIDTLDMADEVPVDPTEPEPVTG